MKRAIISDIHGNLEALERVLADIKRRNDEDERIREIICLGDIVGYGPNPRECQERLLQAPVPCRIITRGNHETGVVEKIRNPELELRVMFRGLGAYAGILRTICQLYGSHEQLPEMPSRPEPALQVTEEVDKYNDSIDAWKEKIERRTQAIIAEARLPDKAYREQMAQELCDKLELNATDISFLGRLKNPEQIARRVLETGLTNPKNVEYLIASVTKFMQRKRGNELFEMLASLPTYARKDRAFFVHDNPLNPGDCRYVLDQGLNEKHHITSHFLPLSQVFQDFDWSKTQWVFYGHTHFAGVYRHPDDPHRIVANPGSVGIPRRVRPGKGLETSYAIWNSDVQGLRSVELIYLPLQDWEVTGLKMEQAGLPNKLKQFAQEHELIAVPS